MLRTRLLAEGIFATVVHEHHVQANWAVALAIGGAKVLVLQDQLIEAKAVFARCSAGDFVKDLEEEFGDLNDWNCPSCGSTDVVNARSGVDAALAIVVLFALGVPIPVWADRHRCGICGAIWQGWGGNARLPPS